VDAVLNFLGQEGEDEKTSGSESSTGTWSKALRPCWGTIIAIIETHEGRFDRYRIYSCQITGEFFEIIDYRLDHASSLQYIE